jgi:hypothetical protein
MALIFAPGLFPSFLLPSLVSPFQSPPFVSGVFFPTLCFLCLFRMRWMAAMPCFRFALRMAWSFRVLGLALSACE